MAHAFAHPQLNWNFLSFCLYNYIIKAKSIMRKLPYLIILIIFLLVLFPSLRHQSFSFLKPEPKSSNVGNSFYDLNNSFYDSLITQPQKYHNKQITIKGFVQLKFEHCALYKSEFFTKLTSDTIPAFWLNIFPTDSLIFSYQGVEYDLRDIDIKSFYRIFNNKYVEIVGRFNQNNKGHLDSFLASIENINSIKIYNQPFPEINI